jgi:2-amino-4-hydroxy-6-hydroxymethyldihydropteridine diphosphokinase
VNLFVVGVGASGEAAPARVEAGIDLLASSLSPSSSATSSARVLRGRSRRYANPPWGGSTRAPFVNAAVVVATTLAPRALLGVLFVIERRLGRVRAEKNAARTLDLDLLWSPGVTSSTPPLLPHPRFLGRSFAVVPAVEALDDAGVVVPLALREAARQHGLAPLRPLPDTA